MTGDSVSLNHMMKLSPTSLFNLDRIIGYDFLDCIRYLVNSKWSFRICHYSESWRHSSMSYITTVRFRPADSVSSNTLIF